MPSLSELRSGKLPKDPAKKAIFEASLNDPKILKLIEIQNAKDKNEANNK
jgi:hypothetical protein